MDKRGISRRIIIIFIIIVVLLVVGFLAYKFKWLSKSEKAESKSKGLVFDIGEKIESKALDPTFEYLFGKSFRGGMEWLIGSDKSFGDFFNYFVIGLVAIIIITLFNSILGFLGGILNLSDYWKTAAKIAVPGVARYVGLIIFYPTLMMLPFIGPFIRLITFYRLIPETWIQALIISVYTVYFPNLIKIIIQQIIVYRAQRGIFQVRKGQEILKAAGK